MDCQTKVWWKSKTVWVGIISLAATLIQAKYGFVVPAEYQGYALTIIMIILRAITNEPVTLKRGE